MLKNLLIILCSWWLAACGGISKEKEAKTISWGTRVAQKLDSVYQKEAVFVEQWLTKTEKMKAFFANNQEKKESFPTKLAGLSEKIDKNTDIVFYTDSIWKTPNTPFLPPISTIGKNIYARKYQKNWDSTLFSSILRDQEDIERNAADLQNLINSWKNIQYIVVYKMVAFKAPKITDLGFEKGTLEVQAFLYNLETENVLVSFSLKTENKNFETFQSKDTLFQEEQLTEFLHQQIKYQIQEYLNTCCK